MAQEAEPKRVCIDCGATIERCDGFTHAGDFADMMAGTRVEIPRERCGRCVLRTDADLAPFRK